MKKIALFGLVLTGFTLVQNVQAAEIQNFQVIRNDSQLNITWDPLSAEDFEGQVGYAVTWGDFQSQVAINEYPKQYLGNVTNLSIRGTDFRRNSAYYFRVFTYEEEGRDKYLTNGSKILKWKDTGYGNYDTDLLAASDPLVIRNSSGGAINNIEYDFGGVRVVELDTFADVSWSAHTKMAKSDYDGFTIEIASDIGFTNILGTLETQRGKIRARIKGLTPVTQYYVRGSFRKDDKLLGTGEVKQFQTINAIPRDASTVSSRNLLKIEKRKYLEMNLGETVTAPTTSTDTNTTSSTSSTTSSSTNTSTTSSTSSSNTTSSTSASSSSLAARIKAIESQISKLNTELIRLKAQLRRSGGSTTSARTSTSLRTTTSRSSTGTSIRERLAARLARMRSK